MIKIGNLAKICNTSTQTLRYYDAEGVLKADYVDEETGYRFYNPEAVEKYKKIVLYKSLGFSLEEIKVLTALSEEEARKMLLRKKEALQNTIENMQKQTSAIEVVSRYPNLAYPLADRLFSVPFTDDPAVIGKWEFCGVLSDENDITGILSQEYPDRLFLKELAFLPGGELVWMFYWTKGILYRHIPLYGFSVPNPYRIVSCKTEKYLILQYMSIDCIEKALDPDILLFRQIDNIPYTDQQVRKMVDRTDLPFVEDPAVCGEWTAIDYLDEISDYNPLAPTGGELYTVGYRFLPQGLCVKILKGEKSDFELLLKYTKGLVLNENEMTAEAYEIHTIENREVLFVQHKSGDYSYGGLKPHWYVFIRKE